DDERATVLARAYQLVRDREPVYEAAAHRLDVERGAARRAELRLHDARRARENVVRRRGGDDDEVDLAGRYRRRRERGTARFYAEIARRLRRLGDMPLPDAGARADPLVGGIHARGEIVVAYHPRRQVASRAGDARPDH